MQLWASNGEEPSESIPQPKADLHIETNSSPAKSLYDDTPSLATIDSFESPQSDSGENQGINPQDATAPESSSPLPSMSPLSTNNTDDADVTPTDETKPKSRNPHEKKKKPKKQKKQKPLRRRKRGRTVRVAAVEERGSREHPSIPLPANQYETILRRRAIRSSSSQQQSQSHELQNNQQRNDDDKASSDEKEYGDISLGMKLSILGGKIIVQDLNSLSDGRASPAQLVGVIRRGDVLLSINNISLVNLPIDQLALGLNPLSTPDESGRYQRLLRLRFAEGEGLQLLEKEEQASLQRPAFDAENGAGMDGANELFSLFPMVDQLSGQPLFEPESHEIPASRSQEEQNENKKPVEQTQSTLPIIKENSSVDVKTQYDLIRDCNDHLSQALARSRMADRERFVSEFFTWSDKCSQLLRPEAVAATPVMPSTETLLTRSEMLEIGRRAILGAINLGFKIEELEKGSTDVRSFERWNSSISLHSSAASRRRYVMEVASLPAHFIEADAEDSTTNGTAAGSSKHELDGDELILRLAAHDEIWRKQVVEALKQAIAVLHDEDICETSAPPAEEDVSTEIGNFLFGAEVSKFVTEKKKSKALPPKEITSVLFDLSTQLAFTMPDHITISGCGSIVSLRSTLLPLTEKWQTSPSGDLLLAARFLLDEALPFWLQSFLPLKWEHRRVLWPPVSKMSVQGGGSTAWDDSLTADSFTTTGQTTISLGLTTASLGFHAGKRNKNLREIIEDQELDIETRGETCFLVSYYFERNLVPKLVKNRAKAREELVNFVQQYGCYLKMDTCLAYSAMMECDDAISVLLEVAEYDPRHHEGMKQMTRADSFVIYDSTILSALVKCLRSIRKDPSADHRLTVIHACVSAYPDIRPWQVRKECLSSDGIDSDKFVRCSKEELRELHYNYLSLLLHPEDGHEEARRDASLVEEWCVLSLQQYVNFGAKKEGASRRKNFYSVASPSSNDHVCYHRDLIMLMKLSMSSREFEIALDLAREILDHRDFSQNEEVHNLLLKSLRTIAHTALDDDWSKERKTTLRTLKKVVHLFGMIAKKPVFQSHQFTSVGNELHSLLMYKRSCATGTTFTDAQMLELISFLAEEASPGDVLEALNEWTGKHELDSDSVAVLQTVLRRGAHIALTSELSGSLFHLKRARQNASGISSNYSSMNSMGEGKIAGRTIWGNMSSGLLKIEK